MNPQVVVICTCLGSFFLHHMLRGKLRNWLVPISFAYYYLVVTTLGTVQGAVFHFVFTVFNFVPPMIICDGFRADELVKNPACKAFLVFYGYMFLIGFTGYYPIDGPTEYLQVLICVFGTGYFAARWACRTEGGMQRIYMLLLIVGFCCACYYITHLGALTGELDQYSRLDVSEFNDEENKLNVNGVSLRICSLLPFIVMTLLHFQKKNKLLKLASLTCFLLLLLINVRMGSRNGTLVLIPLAWYFWHASANGLVRMKRRWLMIFVGIMFVVGVLMTNKGASVIRAFDFKNKEVEAYYGAGLETMTTGRLSMWTDIIRQMTPLQKLVGLGCAMSEYSHRGERLLRYHGGNSHSIYVTIFTRSGLIGIMLFLIFICIFWWQAGRVGQRGNMAKMMMMAWLLTGVGESWGMIGGLTGLLAGFGVGLVSFKPVINSELGGLGRMGWMRPGFRDRWK